MLIFAYGTLTVPFLRERVLGHAVEAVPAVLRGHVKVCGWDYLTVIPGDSDVEGVVFDATDHDVELMDIWEEVPVYELREVVVETAEGRVAAHAYIMPEPPEHYETVDRSCIAAIPIAEIVEDLDRLMGGAGGPRF